MTSVFMGKHFLIKSSFRAFDKSDSMVMFNLVIKQGPNNKYSNKKVLLMVDV